MDNNREYMGDWMAGQGLEATRAMTPDEQRAYEEDARMQQLQDATGASNFQESASDRYRNGGLANDLSDAQFGKQAKQAIRDNHVAKQVASAKDQELADMYDRFKGVLANEQAKANHYKNAAYSLAGLRG